MRASATTTTTTTWRMSAPSCDDPDAENADEDGLTYSLEFSIIMFGLGLAILLLLFGVLMLGWSHTMTRGLVTDATRDGAALLARLSDRDPTDNIAKAENEIDSYLAQLETSGTDMRPIAAYRNITCAIAPIAADTNVLNCSVDVRLRPPIDTFFGTTITSPEITINAAQVLELP